jgi:2-polyprenyl-6-methoxyphenol hydroxylase-like FAD-dependent oxidoreductase
MKVLVIGGGIGGLTAGIALRRRGIEAHVYERSPALTEVGAGISLWPNAVKALGSLGLGETLGAICPEADDFAMRRWNGSYLGRTRARDLKRRFGGGVLLLHRAELLDVLARSFGDEGLHLDHACVGIEEDRDGVTARFANGETARGDVLIGADGLRSMVRGWLGHGDPLRYAGFTAWRAVVRFDPSSVVPAETWGRGNVFGIHRLTKGRVCWYATANAREGEYDQDADSMDTLLSLFRGWHEPVEALIRASGASGASGASILRNDIYDRDPIRQWGRGRATLLGDAAHPMMPNLGQGGCQAIEDAVELAWCLAAEGAAGLRSYEAARVERTRSIVLGSRRFGALGQLSLPVLCGLRDMALRLTPSGVSLRSIAPVVGYESPHWESR